MEKEFSDSLFADCLEDPFAYGTFECQKLMGFVEGSKETWHNLFRITNLFAYEEYRKNKLGEKLLIYMIDMRLLTPGRDGGKVMKRSKMSAVLADGHSSRMGGCDKAALTLCGERFFNRMAEELVGIGEDILSTNVLWLQKDRDMCP